MLTTKRIEGSKLELQEGMQDSIMNEKNILLVNESNDLCLTSKSVFELVCEQVQTISFTPRANVSVASRPPGVSSTITSDSDEVRGIPITRLWNISSSGALSPDHQVFVFILSSFPKIADEAGAIDSLMTAACVFLGTSSWSAVDHASYGCCHSPPFRVGLLEFK